MRKIMLSVLFVLLAGCSVAPVAAPTPFPQSTAAPATVATQVIQVHPVIGSVEVIYACAGDGCGKTCSEPIEVTDWVGKTFTGTVVVDQTWDGEYARVFNVSADIHTLAGADLSKAMISSRAVTTTIWYGFDDHVCAALWIADQTKNQNYQTMAWDNLVLPISGIPGTAITLSP